MQDNHLSIGQAAKFLKISIDTLRRWDKKGKIKSYRSPGGHRYFLKDDLKKLQNQKYVRQEVKPAKSPKKRIRNKRTFLSYQHEIIVQLLPAIKIILIALAVILILNFIVIDIILLNTFFR